MTKTIYSRFSRRVLLSSLLVLAVGLILSAGIEHWLRQDLARTLIGERLEADIQQVSEKFKQDFNRQYAAFEDFAQDWISEGGMSEERWLVRARRIGTQQFGGISAIQRVTPDFRIHWIEPMAGNERAMGLDIRKKDPIRTAALEKAIREHQPFISPPFDLVQGGRAVIVYFPLYRDHVPDGFMSCLIRIQPLFENMLAMDGNYGVRISCGGVTEYARRAESSDFLRSFNLKILGRDWTVECHPTPEYLQRITPGFVAWSRPLGLLISLVVAGLCGLLLASIERGRELHAARLSLTAANAALEAARAEAESAARVKGAFLANMSHEIRTPLNGIVGSASLLEHSDLSSEQKELIQIINSTCRSLKVIVDDVLDYSKIEAGRFPLESLPVDLGALLEKLAGSFRRQAMEKGLELHLSLSSLPPLLTDPTRIGQIVTNLLSNAIKFSSSGAIVLSIRKVAAEPGLHGIEIRVQDSGCGISEEAQKRLFRPFEQEDASTSRRFGGTGLGLAISARLATLMGGSLSLESSPGHGSTFTLSLALKEAAATPDKKPETVVRTGSLRILLVEDNPVNAKIFLRMAAKLGHSTTHAEDGTQALPLLAAGDYDLIFMDMQMPGLDGPETVMLHRRRHPGDKTPIVALTANVMEEDRQRCLAAGMSGFLTKPLTLESLAKAIQERLA
ncbi:MAG: hypothetical protein RL095_1861 [Verrucomicrobiota bacterium]|jgi:signal transduction histidine kinase